MNAGYSIIITNVIITQHKLLIFFWMNNKPCKYSVLTNILCDYD